MRVVAGFLVLTLLLAGAPGARAQEADAAGTLYVDQATLVVGATVPCDTATYTLAAAAPAPGKAYTARSFGGSACTTNLDFTVPSAFTASTPITVRMHLACDSPAVSAGVAGATASIRFIVLHGTKNLSGNVNLVGSNTCGSTPLVYQATIDLKGEAFAAGDLLRVQVIPFYTSPGAGDPGKSLHLRTGPGLSAVVVPDLAATSDDGAILYQNVTTETLRVGRNQTVALNQTEVYNWTTPQAPRLRFVANLTGGSVSIGILAANGTQLFNRTVTASGNGTEDLAMGGNLTLRLTYENTTGDFVLELGPQPAGSTTTSSSRSRTATSATGTASNATGNSTLTSTPDDEEAPGTGLVLVLGLLVAVAAVRRRLR